MKEMAVYERNGGENSQIRQSGAEDREKEGKKILRTLFWTDFYISAFTFGGGFVIITLMKKKFVNELHWINEKEMLDFAAMAQSSPGAIAVNAAILVGWKLKKLPGMAAAVLGAILPPMLILGAISWFYSAFASNIHVNMALKGMQAGVAAVILDAALDLGISVWREKRRLSMVIMGAAFLAAFVFDVNVIFIVLAAALIGVCRMLAFRQRHRRRQ